VVAGWAIGYFFKTVTGSFSQVITGNQSEAIFSGFASNPYIGTGLLAVFLFITAMVVKNGVTAGVEKWSKILMPVLFIMLILLAIYSVTLEGANRGIDFYIKPDFSKVTITTFAMALGQAMFSMDLDLVL
jgi:NSS family neurotransmitter:Na+ symporter